ncbi:MAG TPA: hypothetical protein VG900_10885 [Hyphomicrobiaceae bacterium]|jgi:hypothetical protein|nr:hypothetical protein [Hyphomicrobiaceae bacterium]
MPAKMSDSKILAGESGSETESAGALFEPVLESLVAAGLVQFDKDGDWRLSELGQAAMARFYRQVEGSSWDCDATGAALAVSLH